MTAKSVSGRHLFNSVGLVWQNNIYNNNFSPVEPVSLFLTRNNNDNTVVTFGRDVYLR